MRFLRIDYNVVFVNNCYGGVLGWLQWQTQFNYPFNRTSTQSNGVLKAPNSPICWFTCWITVRVTTGVKQGPPIIYRVALLSPGQNFCDRQPGSKSTRTWPKTICGTGVAVYFCVYRFAVYWLLLPSTTHPSNIYVTMWSCEIRRPDINITGVWAWLGAISRPHCRYARELFSTVWRTLCAINGFT